MHDVLFPLQEPSSSHSAGKSLNVGDLTPEHERAQVRAKLLMQRLEAFDSRSLRDSHLTFVLCALALGLLASAAGLYAWMDSGRDLVQWYWLPLAGGTCLLGLGAHALVNGGASQRVRFSVAVLVLGLFVTALFVNGAAPLLFLCAIVMFLHLLLRPQHALIACLWAIGAPVVLVLAGQLSDLHVIVVPRSLASAAFALVVMQLLVRRNLAFQGVTASAAESLQEVIKLLTADLSATRKARDLAERALAAQQESDARLGAYTRLTKEALQCMSQGMAVIDLEGRVVLYNDRLRQFLDLPAELMDSQPLLSDLVDFQARRGDFGSDYELVEGNAAAYVHSRGLDPSVASPPKYLRKTLDGRFLEIVSHHTASGYLVRTYSDVSSYQRVTEQMTFALADRDQQLTEARNARKDAEDALRAKQQAESERDEAGRVLVSVVEASSQGLLVVGRDGRVLVFNEKLCDMLQMPRSLLERKPHYREMLDLQKQRQDLDPALYARKEYRADLPHNLEDWGKQSIDTYTRQSADGRHLEVSTQFIAAGYVVRTYTDVTPYVEASMQLQKLVDDRDEQLTAALVARAQAAQALQDMLSAQSDRDRANLLLVATLKTTSHGVMATGPDGRVSFWNDKLLELLSLSKEFMSSKPLFSTVLKFQIDRGDFEGNADVFVRYLQLVLEEEQKLGGLSSTQLALEEVGTWDSGTPELHRVDLGLDFYEGDATVTFEEKAQARKAYLSGLPELTSFRSQRERSRYTRKTIDGRFIEVTRLPMPYGGVLRTYSDITEYVRANQRLEDSLEQLHMVELQLKAELKRSNEAMDLQARFVAAVSHEIRTPLNGIVGMAELLEQSALQPEQKQQLDDLRTSTRQLRRLTDDILDLARMRDSKFALETRRFNVWQQVRSCVAAAQAVAKRKGLPVELELRGSDFQAIGDPERFSQILNNLLFNAIKFTARGAVQVSGFWEPSDADPNGIEVHLSLADSGRGIDTALIAQIFEPFHQGEEMVNRNFGGTGLGLALCRELCEAMGGHIQVSSRPGHGSVFSFTVRLLRSRAAEDEPETHPADLDQLAVRLEGARILVVDDNRINQKLMQVVLSQAGAAVASAFNGREAVQLASSQSFDCVLMDMSMPVMNGLQASQAIRQLVKHDDPEVAVRAWVPIIGVTAMARREDRQLCLEAGMNAHLSKPVERAELFKTISKLLNDAAWLKSAGSIYADSERSDSAAEDDSNLMGQGL